MIVWWFERVVATYHVAADEGVELGNRRVCVVHAIAEAAAAQDSVVQREPLFRRCVLCIQYVTLALILPGLPFPLLILAAEFLVSLLFGHCEIMEWK